MLSPATDAVAGHRPEGSTMPTKITLILDNPADAESFEAGYPALADRARALPGLRRMESGKVFPKEDGTATPAHRTLDLYFDDYAAASRAVATVEAGEFFQQLGGMKATFTGLFLDVEEK
jgi:hypothetical protein